MPHYWTGPNYAQHNMFRRNLNPVQCALVSVHNIGQLACWPIGRPTRNKPNLSYCRFSLSLSNMGY